MMDAMRNKNIRQQIASLLRRYPWILAIPYRIWRRFQRRYSVGAVGVLFNDDGHILLVEHVFHPLHPWGLPGGWVGRAEDPTLALAREFEEELGLHIHVGVILLAESQRGDHLDLAYLCETTGHISKLSYELLQYRWFTPNTLPALHSFHTRAIHQALILMEKDGTTHGYDT